MSILTHIKLILFLRLSVTYKKDKEQSMKLLFKIDASLKAGKCGQWQQTNNKEIDFVQ